MANRIQVTGGRENAGVDYELLMATNQKVGKPFFRILSQPHWLVLIAAILFTAAIIFSTGNQNKSPIVLQNIQSDDDGSSASKKTSSKKTSTKSSSSKKKTSSSKSSKSTKDGSEEGEEESLPGEVVPADDEPVEPLTGVGNRASNVVNGGFLASKDGYLYYTGDTLDGGLYKMDEATGETCKLSDEPMEQLNLLGDRIYSSFTEQNYMLGMMDEEGDLLHVCSVGCDNITALPEGTVVSNSTGIYLVNDDLTQRDLLYQSDSEDLSCVSVFDTTIYFIEGTTLRCIDIDGENIETLAEDTISYSVSEDGLYYLTEDYTVYDYDTGQAFDDVRAGCINVYDGALYYSNLRDGGMVYRVFLDGGRPEMVSPNAADHICIADGYIAIENHGEVTLLQDEN